MKTQYQELINAIKAGYSYFYVQTYEVNRTVEEIKGLLSDKWKSIITWDYEADPSPDNCMEKNLIQSAPDTVVLAKNFSWFMADEFGNINKMFVQMLQNHVDNFSSVDGRKIFIILGDSMFAQAIPKSLEKDFLSIEVGLPNNDDIKVTYDKFIDSAKELKGFKAPNKETEKSILESCRGMTNTEISNALAYTLITSKGKLDSKPIRKIRAKGIEKTAGIKVGNYSDTFDSLKGYENIKQFTKATLMGEHPEDAKGVLLLGPAGVGKTHFTHCLGSETGLEVYEMEVAQLFGGLVGESEKLMKAALDIISANAPAILLIDEIEKALAGMGKYGANDGGTTQRSMAQLLKFLSDGRPKGIYVVATCNNISSMPPEWVRAERWDCAPFFIDLPCPEEQDMILAYYQKQYNVKGVPRNMDGWSGAEIKSACRIAHMMGKSVEDVERFIIPVSKTMEEDISLLRKWSENKTIPASTAMRSWDGAKKTRSLTISA